MERRKELKRSDRLIHLIKITRYIIIALAAVAVALTMAISFKATEEIDRQAAAQESLERAYENQTGAAHESGRFSNYVTDTGRISLTADGNTDNNAGADQEKMTAQAAVQEQGQGKTLKAAVQEYAWQVMDPEEFRNAGVVQTENWAYTWYSEQVLPGGGLKIPGRHTDEYGFVRDCDGYLCVACNDIPQGYPVDTPFGTGKVYDIVGEGGEGVIDIYVNW